MFTFYGDYFVKRSADGGDNDDPESKQRWTLFMDWVRLWYSWNLSLVGGISHASAITSSCMAGQNTGWGLFRTSYGAASRSVHYGCWCLVARLDGCWFWHLDWETGGVLLQRHSTNMHGCRRSRVGSRTERSLWVEPVLHLQRYVLASDGFWTVYRFSDWYPSGQTDEWSPLVCFPDTCIPRLVWCRTEHMLRVRRPSNTECARLSTGKIIQCK